MGFPRQEYWSGLSFPSPGDLPDPGINAVSPAKAGVFFTTEPPGEVKVKAAQSCPTLWPRGLYSPWDSPGQSTGVGSRSLLQRLFPTQGSNPGLPHCRRTLYQLSHKGSPRILEWVAYPFSSGSSQPRNWTGVSCIAGVFFTNWAIREAPNK